jgi:hypothetical protein
MKAIPFLAIILLVSCDIFKTDKYNYMPDKYKSDLRVHDTVYFSGNSTIDTLYVFKIENAYVQWSRGGSSYKGPYERWEIVCLYYYRADCYWNNCHLFNDSNTREKDFGEGGDNLCDVYNAYRICVGYYTTNYLTILNNAGTSYGMDSLIRNIEVGDTTYRNIYKIEFSEANSDISEIYYDYKKGIIRYVKNGILFNYLHSSK